MATILLTGASSFSGFWIARGLAEAGHVVVAPLKQALTGYDGLRLDRVRGLEAFAEVVPDHPIGSDQLARLVAGRTWDVLAHHAADIPNYRDADYDAAAGFARNIAGAEALLAGVAERGGRAAIVTGTTFEMGEGGDPQSVAVSPYGLSKGLTNMAWRHFARWRGLRFGKFVIAAPFGRWEERRLVWSLAQAWFERRPAIVRTPAYVRDNLPAPMLGAAYAGLVDRLSRREMDEVTARPAGFVGTQGEFARRVAREMTGRLGLPCEVEDAPQASLAEPLRRVNDEPAIRGDWDEARFWDDYADYYLEVERRGVLRAQPA